MHNMSEEKKRFGISVSEDILVEIDFEVKRARHLKATRSEVIEVVLSSAFSNVKKAERDDFSKHLWVEIIERRKDKK